MKVCPGISCVYYEAACSKTKTKTKTKVILLWPITKDENNTNNQSELEAHTCNWRQVHENVCDQVVIGFDWLRK